MTNVNNFLNSYKEILYLIFLSLIFALTVQSFELFKGNANYLIYAIKEFDDNKLQYDWIANQAHHLPLFTYFNNLLIKIFSKKVIYVVHYILLGMTSFFLFLISKNLYPEIKKKNLKVIWFSFFIFLFHEKSFFSGVAGQTSIDAGYQPASFAILFFISIYFFIIEKNFLSVVFVCLSASFHPTYVLHSGFLILGILGSYLIQKKYRNCLKIFLVYFILILPITLYIIFNFLMIDENLSLLGKKILLDRIPHHANINSWATYKDIFFLCLYFYSLFLIKNNRRFFIFFSIFGFFPILLSVFQYFINIDSLALSFPWRSSVFIAPISSIIILSYFLKKIQLEKLKLRILSFLLIISVSSFFFIKSHYIKDLNKEFKYKLVLTNEIKKNFDLIDRILTPTDLDYIRMNSGLPVFINWKHHTFRYDQLIEWRERVDLADNFYESKSFTEQLINLQKIQKIDEVSHILIRRNDLDIKCKDFINHDIFSLVSVSDCYKIKVN